VCVKRSYSSESPSLSACKDVSQNRIGRFFSCDKVMSARLRNILNGFRRFDVGSRSLKMNKTQPTLVHSDQVKSMWSCCLNLFYIERYIIDSRYIIRIKYFIIKKLFKHCSCFFFSKKKFKPYKSRFNVTQLS